MKNKIKAHKYLGDRFNHYYNTKFNGKCPEIDTLLDFVIQSKTEDSYSLQVSIKNNIIFLNKVTCPDTSKCFWGSNFEYELLYSSELKNMEQAVDGLMDIIINIVVPPKIRRDQKIDEILNA